MRAIVEDFLEKDDILKSSKSRDSLREVLLKCAYEAVSGPNEDKYIFYPDDFKRLLCKYWLYNEDDIAELPSIGNAFGSYVFLLQKNISITNIALPEVVALIRHSLIESGEHDRAGNPRVELFSTRQYRSYIARAISLSVKSFDSRDNAKKYVASTVVENVLRDFGDFLLNTLAVSSYSTSLVLHIPRSVRIDLENLVAQSGYIHSAGYQVYVALSDRSDSSQLIENLDRVFKIGRFKKPLFFAPYCEEYFSGEEGNTAYSMSNGLDGVKFAARKQHIGKSNLLDLVSEIGDRSEFVTPVTSAFLEEKRLLDGIGAVDKSAAVFLIADHGLGYSKTTRTLRKSGDQYVLCYLQQIKNSNILHVLKERKPGWTGPVTIPHTLAAAMVNINRDSQREKNKRPLIFDPFCGSATFLIEAGIRNPDSKLVGIDRHTLFHSMNADNFQFLSEPTFAKNLLQLAVVASDDLKYKNHTNVTAAITSWSKKIPDSGDDFNKICPSGSPDTDCLHLSLTLVLSELAKTSQVNIHKLSNTHIKDFLNNDVNFSSGFSTILSKWESKKGKASVYFFWRAICSNSYRIKPQNDLNSWVEALCRQVIYPEIAKLKLEYQDIIEIEKGAKIRSVASNHSLSTFEISQGLYSPEVRLSKSFLKELLNSSNVSNCSTGKFLQDLDLDTNTNHISLLQGDSLEFMKSIAAFIDDDKDWSKFRPNVILTDPPYSFNVVEGNDNEMQALFHDLVFLIPKIIAPNGVASIVVPSFSRNGQTIPFYQSNEVFTRRMLSACAAAGRQLLHVSHSVPDSVTFPKLPYTWNSQRGVSRYILNFMIE